MKPKTATLRYRVEGPVCNFEYLGEKGGSTKTAGAFFSQNYEWPESCLRGAHFLQRSLPHRMIQPLLLHLNLQMRVSWIDNSCLNEKSGGFYFAKPGTQSLLQMTHTDFSKPTYRGPLQKAISMKLKLYVLYYLGEGPSGHAFSMFKSPVRWTKLPRHGRSIRRSEALNKPLLKVSWTLT